MTALRQVLTDHRVGVVEQPLEQFARCAAVRADHHGRAYRRIRVLGERHPEGVRQPAVERERVRQPVFVQGDDLGDQVIGQVRAPDDAAMTLAVGEETANELGRQRGILREASHHLGEVNRRRYGVRHGT
ncbi:hypothetical protein [Streptomyces viridosporus]|uniref:hypothetical protein n=1 Tax=Streptomyces viridosporus TaxID=67581 RepID=UPI0036FD7114